MSLTKDSEITDIWGIGSKLKDSYNKLGIYTARDLLFHIPFRYQDTSSIVTIEEFKEKGQGSFLAQIEDIKTTYFRKKITTLKVKDDTGTLRLSYFNQAYLEKSLDRESIYIFNAKITEKNGRKNIYNPKFEKFQQNPDNQTHLGKWIGIYPETKGITSRMIRSKIKLVLQDIDKIIQEPFEAKYLKEYELISLPDAIKKIHFPKDEFEIQVAQQRLSFDEMLRIGFKIEKQIAQRKKEKSNPVKIKSKELNQFVKSLPFKLTKDQDRAVSEILDDMNSNSPMNRLLNGDVGSGKTVVSAIAILNSILNNFSCILIAPTTVLAQQHFDTFKKLFDKLNIDTELCISTKKTTKKVKNKLIIGTHAILYEKELPLNLNLVVIDEQHRFGVEQREYFKQKSKSSPHYLTMTATPIPRSLTEIFFGGLDVSEIREMPKGRKEVKTYYTPFRKREDCFNWIKEEIKKSRKDNQAFIIYPLIEESEVLSAKAVLTEFNYLKDIFDGLNIQFLHGRIKPREKEKLLEDFRKKKINILVSTTVIEVGIDIPDATVMVIEDAERFGLAQLHQLRGRVGRSNKESYCFIIPNSNVEKDSPAEKRLTYFANHSSGFEVAEYDLKSRGPGEVYGLKQSGIPIFKVASIHNIKLLKDAREVAKRLLTEDNNNTYILNNLFE